MDPTATHIVVDERGWCKYGNNFEAAIEPNWHTEEHGAAALKKVEGILVPSSLHVDLSVISRQTKVSR